MSRWDTDSVITLMRVRGTKEPVVLAYQLLTEKNYDMFCRIIFDSHRIWTKNRSLARRRRAEAATLARRLNEQERERG